ncbi:aminocarboxymuconate-semialdehyde decarboxylase [Pandoraea iniqua]|uniref:amidohydrolase family protein n=1 Tax=Pandoraea iniqua TaxID=2508288 RepID=UPI0012416B4E|nr:amidohydrolase family protein [Pandoraea iniqua]VVD74853.1 aminocarboxymuconate-semialdehyde decarboxylase [Pandoraea iniqua]
MAIPRIALDVHAHLAPIEPSRLLGIDGVRWDASQRKLDVDGHIVGIGALFSPESLIAWMDEQGIERAWVSIPPPLYRAHLPEEGARVWCRYVNDALADVCAKHESRLAALVHLPLEHPELAHEIAAANTRETRYAAAAGGYDGTLSDDAYAPLWRVLDRQGAFVFLHPGHCCDTRLANFYLENLMGNPVETAVAASHLVFGGVAARHPKIRFCLAHGGGATAMLAGRYERGYRTARPGVDTSLPTPRTTLGRFYVDSIVHDPQALALSASVFGQDHVLFGSDWPFPMGLLTPHTQLADADPALAEAIRTENAHKLLDGLR